MILIKDNTISVNTASLPHLSPLQGLNNSEGAIMANHANCVLNVGEIRTENSFNYVQTEIFRL